MREALDNAEDVLNLMLLNAEKQAQKMPVPRKINSVKLESGEIATIIKADTDLYSQKAV